MSNSSPAGSSECYGRHRANGSVPVAANGSVPAAAPNGASASTPDLGAAERLDLLVGDLARVLGCEFALVCEPDGDGRAHLVAARGIDRAVAITPPRRVRRGNGRPERGGRGGGFVGRALAYRRPAYETLDPERDAALIDAAPGALTHALAVPVERLGARGTRVLVAGFSAPLREFDRALWIADAYARLVSLVERADALGGLLDGSRRDDLTGCLTYQGTVDELTREINRSARADLRLSCCFIDLDGFKRVNDLHGHLVGNEVLADVGLALRQGVRSWDSVGRYGGDEFVAILPQTNGPEAALLAERLRSLIAGARPGRFDGQLTASIGVAEWTAGTSSEQLLACADSALFAAKALPGGVAAHSRHSPIPSS